MVSIAFEHDLLPPHALSTYCSATDAALDIPAISPNSALLGQLPTELILEILETTIASNNGLSTITSLLLVCKGITPLVESIIYRSITLPTTKAITALHSTTHTKPHIFFQAVVKEIIVTCVPTSIEVPQLQALVNICSGLNKLVLPTLRPTASFFSTCFGPLPQHLTLETWNEDPKDVLEPHLRQGSRLVVMCDMWSNLTHLCIRQPSNTWCCPIRILQQLGDPPKLTHLYLVRRIHANAANDLLFAEDVREILKSRPGLEQLVVDICPSISSLLEPDAENTHIVRALRPLCHEDGRLVLQHFTQN